MTPRPSVVFHDFHPKLDNILEEVLAGLNHNRKTLPPKLFYDQRGAELFEKICTLEEYYLTRTEIGILRLHSREMASLMGENCLLIEYGSGNSLKIRILLDSLKRRASVYMPIDISKEQLLVSAGNLASQYPGLGVVAVCADYMQPFDLPNYIRPVDKKVIFFPGSTIGNFSPDQALEFLKNAFRLLSPGGGLLIGVDLKKNEGLLNAAYNDAQGVTAEFNLNLLWRINRELGGNFALNQFRHHAFYNPQRGCIEMHLISLEAQMVHVGDSQFWFEQGETIHTEDSFKYTVEEFQALAFSAGFESRRVWTDPNRLFSIHYLTATE